MTSLADSSARARAWYRSGFEDVCDRVYAWEHGTVVRASRYPDIYDLNLVVVERATGVSAAELVAVVDREMDDCLHGRLDVEDLAEGRRLRPELEALGWKTVVLVWMVFDGRAPGEPAVAVEEVGFDDLHELRREWHEEDMPGNDPSLFHAELRDLVEQRGGWRCLAVRENDRLVACAELQQRRSGSEVAGVFVTRARRGHGLGTAVTTAAIRAGLEGGGELWICADDEDRAWPLYERLGFRRAWRMVQFTRLPAS